MGGQTDAGKCEKRCSFCGRSSSEVGAIVSGPSVCICNQCVRLCSDALAQENLPGGETRPQACSGVVDTLRELVRLHDATRQQWVQAHGDDEGYEQWFGANARLQLPAMPAAATDHQTR
jgi:hypothetical protein